MFDVGADPSIQWRGPKGQKLRPEGPKNEAQRDGGWSSSGGDAPLPISCGVWGAL